MGTEAENRDAFRIQARYCRAMDAATYAGICDAQQVVRVRSWPGDGAWHVVATAHAHGTRVDTSPLADGVVIDLPATARVVI